MGRPKICWEDDVKKDIQRLKVPNWKTFVQDRRRWKEVNLMFIGPCIILIVE